MPPLEIDYRAWEDKVIKINLQLKTSRYIQWSNIKDHFFVCSGLGGLWARFRPCGYLSSLGGSLLALG